jgi:hypothetical protein
MKCDVCHKVKDGVSAIANGDYYPSICRECISELSSGSISSGSASFDRRRGYEDNAQDTVQPYNASGPNAEFYRLYPTQALKVFTPAEIEQVKRQL